MIRTIFALEIGLLIFNFPAALIAQERRILAHNQDVSPIEINSYRVYGNKSGENIDIQLNLKKNQSDQNLIVIASYGNNFTTNISIPVAQLNNLDFTSANFFARNGEKKILTIEIKYGEKNNCFINDDGRSRLTITFEEGEPDDVSTVNYIDCEPQMRTLQI